MITEEEFKKLVETKGRVWNRQLWEHLSVEFEDYIENPDSFLNAPDELFMSYIDHQDFSRPVRARRPVQERKMSPDRRTEMLAKIVAEEARQRRDVQMFRRSWLRGRLLKDIGSIENWVLSRLKEQGLPDGVTQLNPIYPKSRPEYSGIELVPQPWSDEHQLIRLNALEYPTLEKVKDTTKYPKLTDFYDKDGENFIISSWYVPVTFDSILGQLKTLTLSLANKYQVWKEFQATAFLLTDWVPPLLRGESHGTHVYALPALQRIYMTLDPRLSPAEVTRLYSEARTGLPGINLRDKQMTDKHLALALFAAKHCRSATSPSWDRLTNIWNNEVTEEHGEEWCYGTDRTWNFSRDVKSAWKRVTGLDLEKPKTPGRSK